MCLFEKKGAPLSRNALRKEKNDIVIHQGRAHVGLEGNSRRTRVRKKKRGPAAGWGKKGPCSPHQEGDMVLTIAGTVL